MGSNLISYKSKKQFTVFRSSVEAEYRAMTQTCCELIWILEVLSDLRVSELELVALHCDNQAVIQIASNPVCYERAKHIEMIAISFGI